MLGEKNLTLDITLKYEVQRISSGIQASTKFVPRNFNDAKIIFVGPKTCDPETVASRVQRR